MNEQKKFRLNSSVKEEIDLLPLSWARSNTANPRLGIVDLPYNETNWIPTAEIPLEMSFDQFYEQHLAEMDGGFVLQNCSPQLRDFLISKGSQASLMGAEARIDLPWQAEPSLRELIRRGLRHGEVRELDRKTSDHSKLNALIRSSAARQEQLHAHIERSGFDQSLRAFAFESDQGFLGAVTLSMPVEGLFHTEMILRHKHSPNRVMEALIGSIASTLAKEGHLQLSLGAVTPLPANQSQLIFEDHRHPEELWLRSQFLFRLGRALNFAFNAR